MGQKSERVLGVFDEVEVQGPIELILVESNEEKLIVDPGAFSPEEVVTNIKREALTISLRRNTGLASDDVGADKRVKVFLHYRKLLRIRLSNSSALRSEGVFKGYELRLIVSNVDVKDFEINLSRFIVKVLEGGKLEGITGSTGVLNLEVNRMAQYDGMGLEADFVIADVIDKGAANVRVEHKLHADVRSFGVLNYWGDPKELIEKKKSGGQVNKM